MKTFRYGIVLLFDGARPDVMEQLLADGALPHIKRMIENGGSFQRAVTAFPSTTGPAHVPFMTGCYPGTCNLPGIRWFNRRHGGETPLSTLQRCRSYVGPGSFFMDTDLAPGIPSLFEYFERPVGIFTYINRGLGRGGKSTRFIKSICWLSAHFGYCWGWVDRMGWRQIHKALDWEADLIFAVLPGVDEFSHLTTPFSDRVIATYRALDQAFGKLLERLRRMGRLADTLVAIISDHGLSATHSHLELYRLLENRRLHPLYYPKIHRKNIAAASMVSGNGMAHVYIRSPAGWGCPTLHPELRNGYLPGGDLVGALLSQDAVDLVATRDEQGGIRVCSRDGEVVLDEQSGGISYQTVWGDPFCYGPMPTRLTPAECLALTFDSEYPDALVQLLQLFRSERTGDLVISARRGYDLRHRFQNPKHYSSHGSLQREHMQVPVALNYPLARHRLRTVDLFPTFLKLLGKERRGGPLDGESLVSSTSG